MDLDEFMARSNARAWRGRAWARALLGGAITIVVMLALLVLAAPSTMSRPMMDPPGFAAAAVAMIVPTAGVAGLVIGLAWMWRILRANPEPDSRSWRYRR